VAECKDCPNGKVGVGVGGVSAGVDAWEFKFDGECRYGNEMLMFDGNGDNDGDGTFESKRDACADACLNGAGSNFASKGFIVKSSSGRCFCEEDDSSECEPYDQSITYKRYDWVGCI